MLNQLIRNKIETFSKLIQVFRPAMMLISKAIHNINGYAAFDHVGSNVHFDGSVTVARYGSGGGKIYLGKKGFVGDGVRFEASETGKIRIGDRFTIAPGVLIVAEVSVDIGNNCLIGEYTSIRDSNHRFEGHGPIINQGHTSEPIQIGDNVWIGRGCAILKGVTIGKGVVVGANSVVNKSVPAGTVVAGVPARIIKKLISSDVYST